MFEYVKSKRKEFVVLKILLSKKAKAWLETKNALVE